MKRQGKKENGDMRSVGRWDWSHRALFFSAVPTVVEKGK